MHAIVLNGGPPPHSAVGRAVRPDTELVIAADSGLHDAHLLGRPVDLVVGDMDSVEPDALATAERQGVIVERHPPEKDSTDLALALDAARLRGATAITVVSGIGHDRFDHVLAAVELLGSTRWFGIRIDAFLGPAWLHILHDGDELLVAGEVDGLVSLVPLHGSARGVTLEGFRYPLHLATLEAGTTLGVSNQLAINPAKVRLRAGTLAVIQPNALKES
jgi:thiamine pyrophosphokinase